MIFGGWGYGSGVGFSWVGVVGLILFAALIGSVVWLAMSLARRPPVVHRYPGPGPGWYGWAPPRNPALEELDVAYARGQVSREEYMQRRADLTGWGPPPGGPGGVPGPPPGPVGPGAPPAS